MEKANLFPQEIEILKASGLLHCSPERKGPFEIQLSFEFIHLIVQEFLSAQWFVAKNKLPEKGTSGMVLQFMSGLLARENNDKMMEKLLETVKPNKASDYVHKLLCLKCLNEYGDRELSRKHLVHHFSRYCDSVGHIVFRGVSDIDCNAIRLMLDVYSSCNEQGLLPGSLSSRVVGWLSGSSSSCFDM